MDQKVKSLLVLTPAKLTEWLIKEGLVPQEQSEHGKIIFLRYYFCRERRGGWVSAVVSCRRSPRFQEYIFGRSEHSSGPSWRARAGCLRRRARPPRAPATSGRGGACVRSEVQVHAAWGYRSKRARFVDAFRFNR